MSRITRRERFGLIALLIICLLILGGLMLRRPGPAAPSPAEPAASAAADSAAAVSANKSYKSYKTYKSYKKKSGAKKPRKSPPKPRRHLDEPF
ncbi:MAG: hypothetical protein HDS64_06895 [Bacteroidales bacterium]|nr:hypothetical protein [Bacteroidales bacterium]